MTNEQIEKNLDSNKVKSLDKFTFYRIRTFCGKMLDVPGQSTSNDVHVIQHAINNQKNQNFLVFPLDDNYSVIAAEHSGKVLDVSQRGWPVVYRPIVQYDFANADNQKFLINDNGIITAKHSWKVIDVYGSKTDNNTPIVEYDSRNSDNQKFTFEKVKSFQVSLPTKDQLPPLPVLSSLSDVAPEETKRANTGHALMPCIMVTDHMPLPQRMQESPYYILVKKQFWKRLWHDSFIPNEHHNFIEKTGMSKTVQESMTKTTNISLQADFGFAFKALTLGISASVSRSIEISQSTTDTVMTENSDERGYTNPNNFDLSWAKYALATEFILKRKDGTVVNSWEAVNKTVTRSVSYPQTQTLSCSMHTGNINDDTAFISSTITSE
ncbi:RICIN domain-containing protein [Bacillus mycoides]|uniref:RICIN domain-containing protein n=1 Tax=Bacillus mycoides TaxID=1405 RepID=UPI001F14084B|nr:RICIN domain-containing protein [Bacillus mycoides]